MRKKVMKIVKLFKLFSLIQIIMSSFSKNMCTFEEQRILTLFLNNPGM